MRTLITGGTMISRDPATGDLDPRELLLEDDVIVGPPNTWTRQMLS